MDIEKSGCYKLYKCRSLLACDSGGTVYDTSQRFEDSDGEASYNTIDENQSESGQSESIIYIIDNKKDELKTNNRPASQQILVDPNTHLDDDEFNVNNDSQCDILQYMKEDNIDQKDDCKYYIVQCDDRDSTQNSTTETLDSDSFDRENFEYYCDPINPNSSVEDNSIDSSNNDMVSGNTEAGSTVNHRKRKQTYEVKNNSFTELLEDDDSFDFHRRKLDNPFENLKLSSILKKDQYSNNQVRLMDHRSISSASSNDENSNDPSNASPNEEVVLNFSLRSDSSKSVSSSSPNHKILRVIDNHVRLNSDLTSADYFEYVQPREKIVESDMDKLLSPTIEMEISITNHRKVNQFEPTTTQGQLDCNGNEVDVKENLNHDLKFETSTSNNSIVDEAREVVEQQLASRAARAKELGFEHNFNTSNECVIEEILFDPSYNDIQLEIDWVNIKDNFQPKVPLVSLGNINGYFTQQVNDPFKNVSCSLKDTINDFNRFGGFPEENNHEGGKLRETKVVSNLVQSSQDANNFASSDNSQKLDDCSQSEYHNSFNSYSSFVGASSSISHANGDYDSESVSNSSINQNQPIAPLKMRIKKISENNQYVIDDANTFNCQDNHKKTFKSQKNPDNKYECSSCLDKFRTKKLLNSHILENHNGPYDMECEICLMKFKKSSAHKKHQPWCEKSTALKCEICFKDYCYKAALLRHYKTHNG